MSNTILHKDIIAFHPGAYIEDIIDDLNITQSEFAKKMGVNSNTIGRLVRGKDTLSPELANKLDSATGIDAQTWLNIQNEYNLKIKE